MSMSLQMALRGAAILFSFHICLSAPAQQILWTYSLPIPIVSSPAISADGTVYLGAASALYAVTNSPGGASNKWVYPVNYISISSPSVAADGTVYLPSQDGNLYAINVDGSLRWSFAAQCGGGSAAIASDGTVYVEGYSYFYAVSPSGAMKWKAFVGGAGPYLTPVIGGDGTIYVGEINSGTLFAFRTDGTQKWTHSVSLRDACAISPAGTIYVSAGPVYALAADGTELWNLNVAFSITGPPVIGTNGAVYTSGYRSRILYAISSAGQLAWQVLSGGSQAPSTAPAVDNSGMIYYCVSNSIYALNPQGQVQWTILGSAPVPGMDAALTSPTISPDGTIYASIGATLYVLAGTNSPLATSWPMYQQNARHTGKVERPALGQPQKRSDSNFQFQLYGQQLGIPYAIEISTNLNTWTSLTSVVAVTLPTAVTDLTATNAPSRFYRAVSSQ